MLETAILAQVVCAGAHERHLRTASITISLRDGRSADAGTHRVETPTTELFFLALLAILVCKGTFSVQEPLTKVLTIEVRSHLDLLDVKLSSGFILHGNNPVSTMPMGLTR
jgi:hypothetical protein